MVSARIALGGRCRCQTYALSGLSSYDPCWRADRPLMSMARHPSPVMKRSSSRCARELA
jgi:hypothetical protein